MNNILIGSFLLLFVILVTWKAKITFPIFYLFLLTYYIQYIFSVFLIYERYPTLRREFPISQSELFSYLIPGIGCFFLGSTLFNRDVDMSKGISKIKPSEAARLGHFLLFFSFGIEIASRFIPVLGSVHSITGPLKYAAFTCYIFSITPINVLLMAFIYYFLSKEAFEKGIFIELLTWSAIFFLFFFLRYQLSFPIRFGIILIAMPIILVIQVAKKDYRKAVYRYGAEASAETLAELAIRRQSNEKKDFLDSYGVVATVGRLNQGWHVSKVMNTVPKKVPFADGKELLSDIGSAFLPRVFFPDKKTSGDRSKFRLYTGNKLKRASMTVGVLGDFYLNFGVIGACVGLFFFGAFASICLYSFIKKFVENDPINLIWIPIIFNYWIRANNDFYTVLNSSFKGFIVFLVLNYVYNKLWAKQTEVSERIPT